MKQYRTWFAILGLPLAALTGYGVYLTTIFGRGVLPTILGLSPPTLPLVILVSLLICLASPVVVPFAVRPSGQNAELFLRSLAAAAVPLGVVGAVSTYIIGQMVMGDGSGTLAIPSPTLIQAVAALGAGIFAGFTSLACAALSRRLRKSG